MNINPLAGTETTIITALFVDIGGVLLSKGWGRGSRKMAAEKFGVNQEELEKRHKVAVGLYESGKLTLDEYLELVVFHERRTFTPDQFHQFMLAQSSPYPEMIALVRRLKARYGLKVVAVSNEGHGLNEYRIQTFKLDSLIDSFISSCFVHQRKPEKGIFRIALETAHVTPNQAVYLDDTPMFVEIANRLGIHGILHADPESTRAKLALFGLEDTE